MGIKGLRPPFDGPTREQKRSKKHSHKITAKAKGGSGGCVVTRNGVAENMVPKKIRELPKMPG